MDKKYKTIKVYVHRDRESNWEIFESWTVTDHAKDNLNRLGYETELLFQVNTQTGEAKLIGAEGYFLGEEKYTPGDVDIDEANLEGEN